MVFRTLSFALFFIVFSMSVAEANDAAAVFPASAEERATLTFNPATSSSQCIGNPMTPLCAVETYETCYLWVDNKICAVMGIDPTTFTFRTNAYFKFSVFHYQVENQKVIDAEDVALAAKELNEPSVSPDDVIMQLRWEQCTPVFECVFKSVSEPAIVHGEMCPPTQCRTEKSPRTYFVRNIDGKWQVLGWYIDKTFHGDFWKRK